MQKQTNASATTSEIASSEIDDTAAEDLLAGFASARQPQKRRSGSYQVVSPFLADDEN